MSRNGSQELFLARCHPLTTLCDELGLGRQLHRHLHLPLPIQFYHGKF